jgi:hypothetical protein
VLISRQVLITVAALLSLAGSGVAQQPTTLTGHVNRDDGTPVGGATVAIPALGMGTTSRSDGSYGLLIPGGQAQGQTVTVTARAIGFKPQTVQIALAEGPNTQDFGLAANRLGGGETRERAE